MDRTDFLLIRGELLQQTAASFGGNGEPDWVDHVLCRDGLGRYTLRGECLAGALAATARRLYKDIPKEIGDISLKQPSVWRLFTSHPIEPGESSVRQNVRIHAETGAAAKGALFDAETLPPGTRWPFVLEIDLTRCEKNKEQILSVTIQALKAWTEGYCWLGRSVARGTGWFTLKKVEVAEVGWDIWPNSSFDDIGKFFEEKLNKKTQSLLKYIENIEWVKPDGEWEWCEYQLTLTVAAPKPDDENSYGMDLLSVGGHSGDALLLDIQVDLMTPKHLLMPQTTLKNDVTNKWIADHVFAYTRCGKEVKPYIPGSSIRGVLRHAAEWWANQHGNKDDLKLLDDLFGTMDARSNQEGWLKEEGAAADAEQVSDNSAANAKPGNKPKAKAAALLISDARLADNEWQAVLLKMHAEDEFAGGVYKGALFDRVALIQAQFSTRFVIEAKKCDMPALQQALKPAFALAEKGFVGLGGMAWRGFGHLHWQIKPLIKGVKTDDE
jgi:CRISPR/Cas system CSM-associated protein Csm3 (group 7 of RAMP superfamily)